MVSGFHVASSVIESIAGLTVLLTLASVYLEYNIAKAVKSGMVLKNHIYNNVSKAAILIASKDGEKTIAATVSAAIANGCPVYVVSDGSRDGTVHQAREAGAYVLELNRNVGKPTALYRAYRHFKLSQKYDAIAILDDDVLIEKNFMKQAVRAMDRGCAITVGKNLTQWPDHKRWNIWLAARTYSYWAYQITLRYIQSTYNIMTCISGSNSLYRTEVLDRVLLENTPYIVDDTFWTLETHRLELGEIKYAPKARAWLQDPTSFRDWYKQNLRWMWGTFQGILGHKIGTQANKFHITYLALIFEWLIYICSGPLTIFIIWQAGLRNLPLELVLLCVGYTVWVAIAAAALKLPKLLLFIPAIVAVDFLFRWIMVHGLIKALRQRTVESCVWSSPARFEATAAEAL
jgi:biofilm PGA synthesis N-glycosyltransferase PgaC